MLAVHGDADEVCPYGDIAALIKAARAAGVDAQLLTLPGATHFFPFRAPDARAPAAEAIEQFLDRRR
jgi:alpha-beta hydrolase superfamily lysophospholipase